MPDTQIDFKERLQILKENADSQRKIMFEKLIESKIANVGSNNKEEPILLNKVNSRKQYKLSDDIKMKMQNYNKKVTNKYLSDYSSIPDFQVQSYSEFISSFEYFKPDLTNIFPQTPAKISENNSVEEENELFYQMVVKTINDEEMENIILPSDSTTGRLCENFNEIKKVKIDNFVDEEDCLSFLEESDEVQKFSQEENFNSVNNLSSKITIIDENNFYIN